MPHLPRAFFSETYTSLLDSEDSTELLNTLHIAALHQVMGPALKL